MSFFRSCSTISLALLAFSTNILAKSIAPTDSFHDDPRGTPRLEFPHATASKAGSAEAFLRTQSARYKLPADLSNLDLVAVRQSLIGTHTRFRQLLNGLPVEGAEIIVSQRHADGSIYQVYNNTYPVETPVPQPKALISRELALQKAWDHLHVHGRLTSLPRVELLYMPGSTPDKTGFTLIYNILITVDGPFGYWEHKLDAISGAVLSVRRHEINEKYAADDVPDFSAYHGPTTSLPDELRRLKAATPAPLATSAAANKTTVNGSALVFDPDPRTTLANPALLDTSPAGTFAPAYFSNVIQQISLDAGVYSLEGPWITITNSEAPNTAPSTTTNGIWSATRGNNAFNDAMCYFHIDQNQRYLQSLGYTNAAGIQALSIFVDSDGVGGDDNSYFIPAQNRLAFGHGGVDDDEDADVILHEYGHAITFDTTPSFSGGDSGAIGEGFGDYWGASYSLTRTNGATFNPEWAFSWDGHGADTWTGRFLNMTNLTYDHSRNYNAHQTISGIANYSDQLWGTPIFMALRDLLALGRPRAEMDAIIIESFFGVGSGVKMRDLANATLAAAQELFPAGPHASVYNTRFVNQLILLPPPLPNPILLYPAGGEVFTTGTIINVQWNRNGAPSSAVTRVEFTSQLSGGGLAFLDQVETGTNGWIPTKTAGTDWFIASTSNHSPVSSWFATDNTSTGDQFLSRASIAVSNGAVLAFWHSYRLENNYDGGVVEISTNGSTWIDLGTNATQNGYNRTINSGFSSPIAGRAAFSGNSGGFLETRIPLANYVGKTVSIRFREADDTSKANTGWWIDDISISVDTPWTLVAISPANTSNQLWALPGLTGSNFAVRIKLTASNFLDSDFVTSTAFSVVAPVVNATPTDILLSNTSVEENLPVGTRVGAFGTQDPNPGNTFTYALTNGAGAADNGAFTIAGSNLQTAASFNHEIKSNYTLRVQSTDQSLLFTQKVFTVSVTDVNEPAPAFVAPTPTTNDIMTLGWSSLTNHRYTVYTSTNLLMGFTVLESNIPATPAFNVYTDSILNVPQKFWKITTDP